MVTSKGNGQVSLDSPCAAASAGVLWVSTRRMAAAKLFRHGARGTEVSPWLQQHCRGGDVLLPVCLLELQHQHNRLQLCPSGKRSSAALVKGQTSSTTKWMVKHFCWTELSLIWLSPIFISLQKCRYSLFPVQPDQLVGGWRFWLRCKCLHLWICFHADFHISYVLPLAVYFLVFFWLVQSYSWTTIFKNSFQLIICIPLKASCNFSG